MEKKQDMFRQLPIMEVVTLLGGQSYPAHVKDQNGKTRKICNAIDYLMYVKCLTFARAIEFLQENFSEIVNKTAEKKASKLDENLKYIKVKKDLIIKQLKALGNPIVRVTVKKNEDDNGINLGKRKNKNEYFFNINQLLEMIPQMNKLNSEGYNIFITPIEFEYGDNFAKNIFFLVDDVKDIERLKREVGEPNIILKSSTTSYQAMYIINNPINYEDTKKGIKKQRRVYIDLFTSINKIYGDKKISGLRHPFRLAGYANKKPNRADVWVKILEINPNAKNNLAEWMKEAREVIASSQEGEENQPPALR